MKTARDLFYGAKLKIERADQHIQELNGILDNFLKTDFYDFWIEHDPKAGKYRAKFRGKGEPPRGIPTVLGDALHNLRSALDVTASELVRLSGNAPGKHIRFPIRRTRQDVEAAIKGGEIKVAPATVLDVILNKIKPYDGGSSSVPLLHDLDIFDKHIDVVPVVALSGVRIPHATYGDSSMTDCIFVVDGNGEVCIVQSAEKIELHGKPDPIFTIVFEKGQPFEGKTVMETLHHLREFVAQTVQAIKEAYLRSIQRAP